MKNLCARLMCTLLAAQTALFGGALADEITLAISEPPAVATQAPEEEVSFELISAEKDAEEPTAEPTEPTSETADEAPGDAARVTEDEAAPGVTSKSMSLSDIAEGEVIYQDYDNGYWFYSDSEQNIRVEIRRHEDESIQLIWYEADLQYDTQTPMTLYAANPEKPGKGFKYAERISRDNKIVFAMNDDQCGHRIYNHQTVGVIVRDGQIVSNKTKRSGNNAIPNLDVGALFEDGTMKVFQSKDYTAQEYIDMGCQNTLSFGPYIVRDGVVNPVFDSKYRVREPRIALGMIAPRHYMVILCEGRTSRSQGVGLKWLGEKMLSLGVTQCINLDGGETACILFMGRRLEYTNPEGKFRLERSLSGMIGLGHCEQVPEFSEED